MKLLSLTLVTALLGALAAPVSNALLKATPLKYVALGDSLTAGTRAAGLTAESQRGAYPALFARAAGAAFVVPETRAPGCPPPLGARLDPQNSCARANPGQASSNLAIPGARVEDLTVRTAANVQGEVARKVYSLILGPSDTQVSAALKARPSLITLWIGANNVLPAAVRGDPSLATPPAVFERGYAKILDALKSTGATVVLFTVPDVTVSPLLTGGPRLAALGASANCAASPNKVAASALLSGGQVSCDAPSALTPPEASEIRATVNAYNASIRQLAGERGLKVFDVNSLIGTLQKSEFSPGDFGQPFGPDFSQDGVHPSSLGQRKIARGLEDFVKSNLGLSVTIQ